MTPVDLVVFALGVVVSLITGTGVVYFYLAFAAAGEESAARFPASRRRPGEERAAAG